MQRPWGGGHGASLRIGRVAEGEMEGEGKR